MNPRDLVEVVLRLSPEFRELGLTAPSGPRMAGGWFSLMGAPALPPAKPARHTVFIPPRLAYGPDLESATREELEAELLATEAAPVHPLPARWGQQRRSRAYHVRRAAALARWRRLPFTPGSTVLIEGQPWSVVDQLSTGEVRLWGSLDGDFAWLATRHPEQAFPAPTSEDHARSSPVRVDL